MGRASCVTRTRNGASTSHEPIPLASSLSVTDVTSAELAVALGAWSDSRPWDGMRRTVMHEQLRLQAGKSVWREPRLQAAALLRQQAGTPLHRDTHPFRDGAQMHLPLSAQAQLRAPFTYVTHNEADTWGASGFGCLLCAFGTIGDVLSCIGVNMYTVVTDSGRNVPQAKPLHVQALMSWCLTAVVAVRAAPTWT